jgi:hypothetical protein
MGQQQLMLIICGVIVVGIAISVGIYLFWGTSVTANKDAIVNDMMNLGQYAYRYKLRPEPLGGGGLTYTGFQIPTKIAGNEDADFTVVVSTTRLTFTGTSRFGYGTVVAVLDSSGNMGNYTYTGDFQ